MHIQETSYTVSSSMKVIQTFSPEELPSKSIDLESSYALREYCPVDSNMPLKYKGVSTRLLRSWVREGESSSGVSCTVPGISG